MSGKTLISFDKVWKTYGRGEAKVHALAGVLKPQHAFVGRGLIVFDYRLSHLLELPQRRAYIGSTFKALLQRNCVFDGQLRA